MKLYQDATVRTALCVWEVMLDAQRVANNTFDGADVPPNIKNMLATWDGEGADMMRNHAIAIAVWIESLFDLDRWNTGDPMWALCDEHSFDWEIVPAILELIEWDSYGLWERPAQTGAYLAKLVRAKLQPQPVEEGQWVEGWGRVA